MITMLLLMIGSFFIAWVAMTLAVIVWVITFIIHLILLAIGKIFKSAKIEAKAREIRKNNKLEWNNKAQAKIQSKKLADKEVNKEHDEIMAIVEEKFKNNPEPVNLKEKIDLKMAKKVKFNEIKRERMKEARQQAKIDKKIAKQNKKGK